MAIFLAGAYGDPNYVTTYESWDLLPSGHVTPRWAQACIIGLLRGVPRGGGSLIFPKVPQSSQTESLGFPSYLNTPGTLRNPTIVVSHDDPP